MKKIFVNTDIIQLGRQGENKARQIIFDISEWLSIYGVGTVELVHQRSEDGVPYPCVTEVNGSEIIWTVGLADTDKAGFGKCELLYIVNDTIVKSVTYKTFVQTSLTDASEEAPAPEQSWVTKVLTAAEDVEEAAKAAVDAAERAEKIIKLEGPLEKGEGENSIQQVGAKALSGISLSDKEINFVSFDSATNVLTLNTDDTFFDYNLIFAFRIANLNSRTYVDIVRVLESRKVGDNWEFTIFSPIEELNLGTPNRLTISAIINDNSVVSKNNIALFEGSYSAGEDSLSAGYKALALAPYSLAIGWGACAGALCGIAIGHNARVIGNYGIAIATDSLAGYCAFAGMAFARALGMYSASFSWYGNSSGDKSFTANDHTEARAENSSAFGLYTVANVKDQFVNGRFNIIDENEEFAEITGNGTGINSRSNARTLDWKGNEWLAGRVRVGANKELLPTENEVRGLIAESKNDYANSIKSEVRGNLVKIDDASPTACKIKVSTQASKVIATSKNLLDLNRAFTKQNCIIINSNSLQANIQGKYYISLYPVYLNALLQELDGYTITLSTAPTNENSYVSMYVSYTDGTSKEARSTVGETSVSLLLDNQGRTIKTFEIRPYRRNVTFTDTETVIEDIQLEIGDRTDFAKPHSEIYKIFDVVDGECEVDSLGTAMTILPDSTSAEVEVVYNVDTKKYVDNAIDEIELPKPLTPIIVDSAMSDTSKNPVQNKVVKAYVDDAVANLGGSVSQVYYYTVAPEDWRTSDGYEAECGYYYYRGHDIIVSKSTTDDPYAYDMHVPSTLHLSLDYQGSLGNLNSKRMGPTLTEVQTLQDCGIICGLGYGWNGDYECDQPICIRCTKNQKPTVTMRFAVTVIYPEGC